MTVADTRVGSASSSFDDLQRKLVPLWNSIRAFNQDEQTIVVVPSITLGLERDGGSAIQALEERFLFLLLLLRQPRARLIYVTSQMIHPSIIDYYLDLLPGVLASHARQRLFPVAPLDGSARPLTLKLLDRPRLLDRIRSLIPNPDRAHLVPYNTTEWEQDLAVRLGIPMYGADPRHFWLGTKSGCRTLFAEEGVPHPVGREGISSLSQLAEAIRSIRKQRPPVEKVLVKLNEGVSGYGNATIDLRGVPGPGSPDEAAAIDDRVRRMAFEASEVTFDEYVADLERDGGVVEERIEAKEIRSPSVQLRVTPLGEVELLSTHDQLLGGASGQAYLGCRFPADTSYAPTITAEAAKIGARLAKEGVIGRFALDFLVVRDEAGGWTPYAIELNLRKGGTTHPFLTLQFLTDGTYDPERAVFTAPSGREKFFVASDHVESPQYRGLTPDDLFDMVVRRGLHFDQSRQTGVVFHMMSALPEHGRVGLTAVADSQTEAQELYERTIATLDEETQPVH
ncbi:MAG TPA: peptide ligase PGM1-related protein [Actinomycetota bacterium]|nr:peptide ligase PGM1-related protein [Actinomycetota bacterium]